MVDVSALVFHEYKNKMFRSVPSQLVKHSDMFLGFIQPVHLVVLLSFYGAFQLFSNSKYNCTSTSTRVIFSSSFVHWSLS